MLKGLKISVWILRKNLYIWSNDNITSIFGKPTDDAIHSTKDKVPKTSEEHAKPDEKGTKFLIHKSFACHHSVFFDRAFNGNSVESKSHSITVKADPKVFAILAKWIYSGKLHNDEEKTPNCQELVYLWVLADELLIPKLHNDAISQFHNLVLDPSTPDHKNGLFMVQDYHFLWDRTILTSPLRKYLVYCMLRHMSRRWFEGNSSKLPYELVTEFALMSCTQYRTYKNQMIEKMIKWQTLDIKEYFVKDIKKRGE